MTLKDAADYIVALPAKTAAEAHWQLVMEMLLIAADRGGIVMKARIATLKALNHVQPDESPAPRKKAVRKNRIIS